MQVWSDARVSCSLASVYIEAAAEKSRPSERKAGYQQSAHPPPPHKGSPRSAHLRCAENLQPALFA